jgi:hypothetical protein
MSSFGASLQVITLLKISLIHTAEKADIRHAVVKQVTRDTGLAKTSADFLDFTGRFMPAIIQKLSAAHCDPIAN